MVYKQCIPNCPAIKIQSHCLSILLLLGTIYVLTPKIPFDKACSIIFDGFMCSKEQNISNATYILTKSKVYEQKINKHTVKVYHDIPKSSYMNYV